MRKRTGFILAVLALGACATSEPERPADIVAAPMRVPASDTAPKLVQPARLPPPERKPVIQRMALDTELLFDFDSALLRQAGRAKLDGLARELQGAKIESIAAVGHADRIATEAYNQALSQERAAAVRDYLASRGFDARQIRAEGRGEREPVTGERCKGLGSENRENLKLVRCLQPDRRVELEVRGVKAGA